MIYDNFADGASVFFSSKRARSLVVVVSVDRIVVITPPPRVSRRSRRAMPLRAETEAYWADIERGIENVPARTAREWQDAVCPNAAAARDALLARLDEIDARESNILRARRRDLAAASFLDKENAALDDLARKDAAVRKAEAYVRGRAENDRPCGVRGGIVPHAALPRARGNLGDASASVASAHREREERWGSAEMCSPLMGGGYTVVLKRAEEARDDAAAKAEALERERQLYFPDDEEEEEEEEEVAEEVTAARARANANANGGEEEEEGVIDALRGWGMCTTRGRRAARGGGRAAVAAADDDDDGLPRARGSGSGSGSGNSTRDASLATTTTTESVAASAKGGYGAQLAMIGTGSTTASTRRGARSDVESRGRVL